MQDLGKMSLVELRAEFVRQGNDLSVLAESRRLINAEINDRISKAASKAKLNEMDEKEKEALKEALNQP